MIEAVKKIGELILKKENKDLVKILTEDPDCQYAICINFEYDGERFIYSSVKIEEYDPNKVLKYLYRKGSSSGTDITPTSRLTDKYKEVISKKILPWFNIIKDIDLSQEERSFLKNIYEEIFNNHSAIQESINEIKERYNKKDSFIVTLKFIKEDEEYYIGDFNVFKRILLIKVEERDLKVFERNKVCSLCKQKKDIVLGSIDVYKFYTLDKPGFITGGFKEKSAWKNYPVCPDCKIQLEEGRNFIDNNLSFKFCGIPYYLIPKFMFMDDDYALEILSILKGRNSNKSKKISLGKGTVKKLTDDEDEILDLIKEAKDNMTVNFLFMRKINDAERILLVIEDVFPSRLRRLFQAKDEIDDLFNTNFTFKNIRNFFMKADSNKKDTDLDKYFLDVVNRIFKNISIDKEFLMKFLMLRIRDKFLNEEETFNFYYSIKDALMFVMYLLRLKLLEMEAVNMEGRIFDEIFNKYNPTFEMPVKRGLFLLGALTEFLLRKQAMERDKKMPFLKQLKSFKMNEEDFKGLLPKVQNKLIEYDAFTFGRRMIAAEISHYLLQAGDNWDMSLDEMNFYFVCGMHLANEVSEILNKYFGEPKEIAQETIKDDEEEQLEIN
ncbi:TIGR02556 family CRISPR-associated protein [Thermovenabulum sp.]|uniref:TIGR02556 family CRISPR-associated protein n=1 Tax=Thermovenabulum sp. TaxID=3100335 RepID=UPI003C7D477B